MNDGNRLNRANFSRFFSKSRKIEGETVSLRYCPSEDGVWRFSVVVSSKTSPLATKRNLLKRRAYASLRRAVFSRKVPLWLVVYIKKGAATSSFTALNKEICDILSRV